MDISLWDNNGGVEQFLIHTAVQQDEADKEL